MCKQAVTVIVPWHANVTPEHKPFRSSFLIKLLHKGHICKLSVVNDFDVKLQSLHAFYEEFPADIMYKNEPPNTKRSVLITVKALDSGSRLLATLQRSKTLE
ncbi:hypothetical protein AVEN_6197-1 [Araneus ventricosus]|uniref:Uncharacterized protein n=1 Tax=Araneus ventricosus TaxID=182803 RepID=A0A4Y2J3G5_ARAVE|nr:hypothetical protein AVEN_6197-1 [Araneus ventricosus]